MKKVFFGFLLAFAFCYPAAAQPAVGSITTQQVGVCDPTPYTHNCIKPNADGSINVSGTTGAITAADGALATVGTTTDSACATDTGVCTGIALQKRTNQLLDSSVAPISSASAESCHVLKASAGTLFTVGGYGGQAEFVMVFNATSAPGDGAVTPAAWGYLPTAGAWGMSWQMPLSLGTGITVCYSSTGPFSKTAISTNNAFSGQVQ